MMKWLDPDSDEFVLESSGHKFCANNRIIGIGPTADDVSEGYDGGIGRREDFTDAERAELADYMIGLWTRFKE